MQIPFIPLVLIIAVLTIYLVWKLMSPDKKKPGPRRFSIRKQHNQERDEEE